MGVAIDWSTGALSQRYDKANTRNNGTNSAGKAWIQFDLSEVWARYGRTNLVSATLTLWGENGISRQFNVAGLADNPALENWKMWNLWWTNAPGNDVTSGWAFDWSKVYAGTNLWEARGTTGIDLARPDLGTDFDQCARYTSPDISAFLKTDTDGKVTFIISGSPNNNNQAWWIGTNGTYANDINLGYTSTNPATYGDVIRDSPTLTLTFVGTPSLSALRFTNAAVIGEDVILQGCDGPPGGAYELLSTSDLSEPIGAWDKIGIARFDPNGNFCFTNRVGAQSARFFVLRVLSSEPVYPPEITQEPKDLTVGVSQRAVFSVVATGTEPLIYYWYHNTNTLVSVGTNNTLVLENVQLTDAGYYSVTVSNLLGVVSSRFALLEVIEPPVIVTEPQDLIVGVGQEAVFSVTATGTPPLTYYWYRNTNTLLGAGANNTLVLTNVQLSDVGKYHVTVSNIAGIVSSRFASLTVTNQQTGSPIILTQPADVSVGAGQTASFNVTVSGASPLYYQWYYNTNFALPNKTNDTLVLTNVHLSSAGKYVVVVTNQYGSATSVFATLTVTQTVQQVLAFPEAEGYGKYATGGRGGAVYEVTTLNPTGTGSLGAALSASGARTVVFRVGGTITGNFTINNGNITIAGQTAPGDGICIRGRVTINADNVIIRYIRVRNDPNINPDSDAISCRGRQNIILDHVSASWSTDEVLSVYQNTNVTIQWCLISEPCAKFVGGTNTGHQFGGIWGNEFGTYHHNLFAHCASRTPRWASGCKRNDYRNNVNYNWDYQSCYGGEAYQDETWNFTVINMIANYYKYGPATDSGVRDRIAEPSARSETDKGEWYVADNYVHGYPAVTADNWLGVDGKSYIRRTEPWPAMAVHQQSPGDAYIAVLAHVGCTKPRRDAIDQRIIQEVMTGTATYGNGGIINTVNDVGGWPTYANGTPPTDSDHDGMPDDWEIAHGLNPNNAADRNNIAPNGYTWLENYLNELGAF